MKLKKYLREYNFSHELKHKDHIVVNDSVFIPSHVVNPKVLYVYGNLYVKQKYYEIQCSGLVNFEYEHINYGTFVGKIVRSYCYEHLDGLTINGYFAYKGILS